MSAPDRDYTNGLNNSLRPRTPGPSQVDTELPDILHPEQLAPEMLDAGVKRESLFPMDVPPPWPYAETTDERIEAVEQFALKIARISEGEYGDWMRRVNMYWWHLAEALAGVNDPEVRRLMKDLQRLVQYNPNWLLIETRREAVAICMKILDQLGDEHRHDVHDFMIETSTRSAEPGMPSYSIRQGDPDPLEIDPYLKGGDYSLQGEWRGFAPVLEPDGTKVEGPSRQKGDTKDVEGYEQ